MAIVLDIILAFSEGIPELNSLVPRTRDNLSVISTETDGEDVRSVAHESTRGQTGVKVPETKCVIPRGRKGELTIGRDDDIRNKVIVSVQDAFWIAVRVLVTSQLPDDDGFV